MGSVLQPRYFGPPGRRLFGVYHPAMGAQRASVLMCPPLLHEQVRSYRFFSQVAGQLAGAGIACLRFDYFGTGDSEGDDNVFSPDGTCQDIALAMEELRHCSGGGPLILMGIRGSALFACRDAVALGAAALWLWQPVVDGKAYLQALQARDRVERNSQYRYPLLRREARSGPHDLMGFALSDEFAAELAACSINEPPLGMPTTLLEATDAASGLTGQAYHPLPAAIVAWADEIDLNGLIPLREARATLEALVADIPRWTGHG